MDTTSSKVPPPRNLRMKEEEEEVPPEIEEDLIMEILLRLEPVSVLRFKRVSKSWYTLITHPSFFRNHAARFRLSQLLHPSLMEMEPPTLLLSPTSDFDGYPKHSAYTILPQYQDQDQDQDQDEPKDSYLKVFLDRSLPAFGDKFSDYFLIDSCNGLLLYHTDKSGTPNQYTVFNPMTNQYKKVPLMNLLETFTKPNEELAVVFYDHPYIVFDPSISLSYKFLAVLRRPPYTHFQLYVYSSSSDDHHIGSSWRHLVSFASEYITSGNTFMFNGVFYWLCHRHSICFDFVKETVSFLSLPPAPVEFPNPDVLYFGEFGGRIRLIQEYRNGTIACGFDILEMELELDSRNWTMKTRVNLGEDQETRVKVMHLYKTVKGEEVALLNVDNETVIPYNITTNTPGKELTIQTIPYIEHLDCLNAFPFTPTLYPLLM